MWSLPNYAVLCKIWNIQGYRNEVILWELAELYQERHWVCHPELNSEHSEEWHYNKPIERLHEEEIFVCLTILCSRFFCCGHEFAFCIGRGDWCSLAFCFWRQRMAVFNRYRTTDLAGARLLVFMGWLYHSWLYSRKETRKRCDLELETHSRFRWHYNPICGFYHSPAVEGGKPGTEIR